MAFSRSTYKARSQKEANPVAELTLILVGLSGSKKIGVASQIQHHLKGFVDDTATESEPASACECQTQEGKVLGLKVTTVITPDVTEDDESNRILSDKVREFTTGEFVVVMVIAAGSENTRTEIDKLTSFDKMAFGRQVQRYSLAVLTGTEQSNGTEDKSNNENSSVKDDFTSMLFDINADKDTNDKQVQILLNYAKTLVKKRREDHPFNPPETSGNSSAPIVNGNGDASATTCTNGTTSGADPKQFELTIDNLPPEDLKDLDICSEVLADKPAEEFESTYPLLREDEERNPTSFVTANPIGCGDLQC